jgi:hypothetical protein
MSEASRLIAFEGMVRLANWRDSSNSGPRVNFALANKDALTPFEKVTKRRGKKAGQRYQMHVADSVGVPVEGAPDECFLAGAQWSHSSGASITLAFTEVDFWRRFATDDDGEGTTFHFVLVQMNDDERPIDQVTEDAMHRASKPKGGPRSKFVAQRNQTPEFQAYVGKRTEMPPDRWHLVGADTCDKWVKQMVGIESKAELDHSEDKWDTYQRLINKPFVSWAQVTYPGTIQ